jgi:hypothetical protein
LGFSQKLNRRELSDFHRLLFAPLLQSPEESYASVVSGHVSLVLSHLFQIIFELEASPIANLSAILLRHLFIDDSFFSQLSPEAHEFVCQSVPSLFENQAFSPDLPRLLVDPCAAIFSRDADYLPKFGNHPLTVGVLGSAPLAPTTLDCFV